MMEKDATLNMESTERPSLSQIASNPARLRDTNYQLYLTLSVYGPIIRAMTAGHIEIATGRACSLLKSVLDA